MLGEHKDVARLRIRCRCLCCQSTLVERRDGSFEFLGQAVGVYAVLLWEVRVKYGVGV